MKRGKTFLQGVWIGSTMTVPGVSGGTMAILIGIYEELIHAVNGLRKEPKRYLAFLMEFAVGGGLGFILFARFITLLLVNDFWGVPTQFLFCGVVAGGIPFLVKKTGRKTFSWKSTWLLVFGAVIVLLLGQLPEGFFVKTTGMEQFLLQIAGGFIVAVALVLPGISVTHMLYILGLYEIVMERVYSFQIFMLFPLLLGVLVGTFLTTHVLETLMAKHTESVYLVILGFVIGSVWELIPKEAVRHPILCTLIFGLGFVGMYLMSKNERLNKE